MPMIQLDPPFRYEVPGTIMTVFGVDEAIAHLAVRMINENAPFEVLDEMRCYMRFDIDGAGTAEGEFCLSDMIRTAKANGYQRGVDIHLCQARCLLEHLIVQLDAAMDRRSPIGWPVGVN
jgi:hypothetical protein